MENENEKYCDDCFNENFTACSECGETIHNDSIQWGNDEAYCQECYDRKFFSCYCCGEDSENSDAITTYNGHEICQGCYENNYFTCERCGEVFHSDNCYGEDRYYCEGCYRDSDENSDNIRNYSYKPIPIFRSFKPVNLTTKTPRYYGIELEVEAPDISYSNFNEIAEQINDGMSTDSKGKLFYLKEDSTIRYGFEIVSHPCDLYSWENGTGEKLKKITDYLLNENFKSHNTKTCGLHIHINKNSMSKLLQIKLGLFLYSDIPKLENFSRRMLNSYCKPKKELGRKIYQDHDRYSAINYTNSHTIEIRSFRGTLKFDTILASIEFIDSCISYCKTKTLDEINSLEWNGYLNFLYSENNIKQYKNLDSYLTFRNLNKREDIKSCV